MCYEEMHDEESKNVSIINSGNKTKSGKRKGKWYNINRIFAFVGKLYEYIGMQCQLRQKKYCFGVMKMRLENWPRNAVSRKAENRLLATMEGSRVTIMTLQKGIPPSIKLYITCIL